MNTAKFYDHQHVQTPTTPPRAAHAPSSPTPSELARHGDRPLRDPALLDTGSAGSNPRVTRWVRATELPEVGMQALGWVIGRGFAAQSRAVHAMTRSARTHVLRRPKPPTAPNRPAPAPTSDGLGLP